MDEIIDKEELSPPRFSGKLENIFSDGTVQYDGRIGLPAEFPLTEAELVEARNPV